MSGEPESEEPFELRYVPTGEDGAQTKGGLLGALFMSQHYNDQVVIIIIKKSKARAGCWGRSLCLSTIVIWSEDL